MAFMRQKDAFFLHLLYKSKSACLEKKFMWLFNSLVFLLLLQFIELQSLKLPFQVVLHLFFGCETKTGVVCIFVIFQDRPMFSRINGKLSPRPFE